MNKFIKKLLFIFIFLLPKVEKIFGLLQFRFESRLGRILNLLSLFIKLGIIGIYPFLCIRISDFTVRTISIVTFFAMLLIFVYTWLLMICIFCNEAFNSIHHHQTISQMGQMFYKLVELQGWRENFSFLIRCTGKLSVSLVVAAYAGYLKCMQNTGRDLPMWEKRLFVAVIQLPFVIMHLASNRIYVANTIIKQLLIRLTFNSKSQDQYININLCSVNYGYLHDFFTKFNRLNAANLIGITTFCVLNIVYQVNFQKTETTECSQNLKLIMVTR